MKKSMWWVSVPGYPLFSMVGTPMTETEALETARCIWATTEGVKVS